LHVGQVPPHHGLEHRSDLQDFTFGVSDHVFLNQVDGRLHPLLGFLHRVDVLVCGKETHPRLFGSGDLLHGCLQSFNSPGCLFCSLYELLPFQWIHVHWKWHQHRLADDWDQGLGPELGPLAFSSCILDLFDMLHKNSQHPEQWANRPETIQYLDSMLTRSRSPSGDSPFLPFWRSAIIEHLRADLRQVQ